MNSGFYQLCCDECGVEITWTPVVIGDHPYCCQDCAVGLECDCASNDRRWAGEIDQFWVEGIESGIDAPHSTNYRFD